MKKKKSIVYNISEWTREQLTSYWSIDVTGYIL